METTDLSLQLVPQDLMPVKQLHGSPFRRVLDPEIREALQEALLRLIDDHQRQVSYMVESNQLHVDSYKEYVELLARFLRETLGSRAGVKFLLDSCGLEGSTEEEINLEPDLRWR
jgi:hypothetical protein